MTKPSRKKKIVLIILSLLIIAITVTVIWLVIPYKTEAVAVDMLANGNVSDNGHVITIESPEQTNTAIIFYPGAKVDNTAYLPLLDTIVDDGNIRCFSVDMPINLAIFDVDAADKIISDNPEIENWYIVGHSLGGAMASEYAYKNSDVIDGLVVLGAYVYGDYPIEKSLTVYGTLNSEIEMFIDYEENIVTIEGGNHAQFGNYGKQPGDRDATITSEQQQLQTTDAILNFIDQQK